MQKMNGRKQIDKNRIYQGDKYQFKIADKDKEGKHGGNGGVYKVELLKEQYDYPVAVKFFEYDKDAVQKEKRYQRFCDEIRIVRDSLSDIDGIMEILDSNYPDHVPGKDEQAWYMMRQATQYPISRKGDLYNKLRDMLRLARILKEMHERGYAHRDIKPENLLVLDGKIYLSDFGLVWTADRPERLTGAGERIGPALILPPELEQADIDADIEYYPSDVYLFAKVVWMVIKSDSWGFRGQYNRKMRQIYLRKEQYAVYTLEPVHRLLEQATYDEIEKRITIQECIDYLQQQIEILEKDKENRLDEHTWHALRYAESSQEFLNQNKPEEAVYIDKIKIYQYLQKILQDSKVYIVNTSGVKKEIKVTSVTIRADQCATLDAYYYGKRVKEYLFCAEKLICREENNTTCAKVELREVEDYDESYVDFEKASTGFGNVNPKIVLSDAYWLELAAKGCL